MEIILTATEPRLADAWAAAFADAQAVTIHRGSIFDVTCGALVSPANSFGFMDGGIDALYSDRFGWHVQQRLRRVILDRHYGELLVGQAEIVETGHAVHKYLIAAPTIRVPMVLDSTSINPFLATRAVFLLLKDGSFPAGGRVADAVQSVAFPGMGTGVGKLPAHICARQMRAAFDEVWRGTFRMPTSWAEASERHQFLYTDCPTRLQY
jgi:O-acetyl-ADP-ribose deacetylase (regulator of RNase III)